jgi:hypothetical protein
VNETPNPPALCGDGLHKGARASLIYSVELPGAQSLGAAGCVDDMGDTPQRLSKACFIAERSEPHFDARQVRFQESPGGRRTEQDRGFEPKGAQAIENVASNKAIGAGQQYLHVAPTN